MYETTKIFVSSDKVKNDTDRRKARSRFPWGILEVGFSFAVPKTEIQWDSLKSLAYKYGKRNDKTFKVVEHDDVYEVARIK